MSFEAARASPGASTAGAIAALKGWPTSLPIALGFLLAFAFQGHFGKETILLCVAVALPLVVVVACAVTRIRRADPAQWPDVTPTVLFFWLWMGVTLLWSPAPGAGLLAVLAAMGLPLGFCAYMLVSDREGLARQLGGILLACVIVIDLYAFLQRGLGGVQRPGGPFLDPNNLGALNVLAVMPVLSALATQTLILDKARRMLTASLVFSLLLMVATIGLCGSRSAVLAAIPGVLVVAMACRRRMAAERRPPGRALLYASIGAIALLAGVVIAGGGSSVPLFQRFVDFASDPLGTAWLRVGIWEASARLLHVVPIYGGGFGSYWMLFPQVQHPEDQSRGFNSHNDYLQFLIEGGVPAILLIAGIVALTCLAMMKLWRSQASDSPRIMAASGLFAGLLALGVQSAVQSNFFLLPLALLAGLALGRFHDLASDRSAAGNRLVIPVGTLDRGCAAMALASLAVLLPTAISAHYYDVSYAAFSAKDFEGADSAFDKARLFGPIFDTVHVAQADLDLKRLIAAAGKSDSEQDVLTAKIKKVLDDGLRVNPLRPDFYLLRGHFQLSDARAEINGRVAAAKVAYQQALALDPKFSEARVALAIVLSRTGDPAGARKLLEQGLVYTYIDSPELLQYYRMTAQARMQSGDAEGALQLATRANLLEKRIASRH